MTARERLRDARAELQRLLYFAEIERCSWAYWLYDAIDSLEEAESEAQREATASPTTEEIREQLATRLLDGLCDESETKQPCNPDRNTCRGCAGEFDDDQCRRPHVDKRACWHQEATP